MTQQRIQRIGTKKTIKKMLAELANREVNWQEQKTREIIDSQRYGFNASSSLRIDFSKNHKQKSEVKRANHSFKIIQAKRQIRFKKLFIDSSDLDHNGNIGQTKRSINQKTNLKFSSFGRNRKVRDQNQAPRNQKQVLLPKLSTDLRKKTSLDFLKTDSVERQRELNHQYLQIIAQQDPSVLKIRNKNKELQKDIY